MSAPSKRASSQEAGESSKKPRLDDKLAATGSSTSWDWLLALLNVSSLQNHTELQGRFEEIAMALLNDIRLVIIHDNRETVFELLEIEFYLMYPGIHEDPFTHGDHEQGVIGKWHFHRAPRKSNTSLVTSPKGWRGGTRKGLDLTFGSSSRDDPQSTLVNVQGGILLRSIRNTLTSEVISGPSLLVDKVLALSGVENIRDLVEGKWSNNLSAFTQTSLTRLFLRRFSPLSREPNLIYSSPRIGLELSNPSVKPIAADPRVSYLCRPYRFTKLPSLLLKKGAQHTFTGMLWKLQAQARVQKGLMDSELISAISGLSGLAPKKIETFLSMYNAGLNGEVLLECFVGEKGKGAGSHTTKVLQMFGSNPFFFLTAMSASLKRASSPQPGDSSKKPRLDDELATTSTSTSWDWLLTLLDVSSLKTQPELQDRFEEIAKALLNDIHLVVVDNDKETALELLEIEFYLIYPGIHDDPFTHGGREQGVTGNWYFHRAPRRTTSLETKAPSGWRGGTRKGLDLTFGDAQSTSGQIRGGILLRSIRNTSTSEVISGPSLLVDKVLALSGAEGIRDLVEDKWSNNVSALTQTSSTRFFLRRISPPRAKPDPVFSSPRIGLELSNPSVKPTATDLRVLHVCRPYRFIKLPALLVKKGAQHTFAGMLWKVQAESSTEKKLRDSELISSISRLSGLAAKKVETFLKVYSTGSKGEVPLATFAGEKGKGAGSHATKMLQMFGAVRRVTENTS
ncbi:hypothetical protein DL96DRAFT_1534931 [Flagelloscypha sp. PMI_526]|nr:hypothetical protein DL96DRAFT_1534931 [Flagelloscypha sp. PMI_526]